MQEKTENALASSAPKVSVLMITYNHEKFIAQAIESVLMQETDFGFELVIGEDCSTDNTREIVLDFARRYPSHIRLLLPESNMGVHENFARTRQACRGQYIALLEGDDYWTSPEKLKTQVTFLDENLDYVACFHDVRAIDETNQEIHRSSSSITKNTFDIEDLFVTNPFHTCSTMFRNGLSGTSPDWLNKLPVCDWPLHILNAQHGKTAFICELLGVYRMHGGGVWSTLSLATRTEGAITTLEHMNVFFEHKYNFMISSTLSKMYYLLSMLYMDSQELNRARRCFCKSIIYSVHGGVLGEPHTVKDFCVGALKLYAPAIHSKLRRIAKGKRHG